MFGILPLRAMYVSVVMIMLSMNCVFVQLCFLPLCLSKSTRYVYFNVSAFVYEQIANMLVALTAVRLARATRERQPASARCGCGGTAAG